MPFKKGHLQSGDFFICNNAKVHGGEMTFEILNDLLIASNVKLVYLPVYSPELNPCELIFAQVKRNLREHKISAIPLWFDISVSFATVTLENVIQYYKKCLYSILIY